MKRDINGYLENNFGHALTDKQTLTPQNLGRNSNLLRRFKRFEMYLNVPVHVTIGFPLGL